MACALPDFDDLAIWRCPRCRGPLRAHGEDAVCMDCESPYPRVCGILDLRLAAHDWVDHERDRDAARQLEARCGNADAATLIRHVYGGRSGWSDQQVARRTREVVEAPAQLRREIDGWLAASFPSGRRVLDLGCGPGQLLAAAAGRGCTTLGVDVSLLWLVVARRLIAEWGGTPLLAAANAEHLPLAAQSVDSVVSLDVIEHVADPAPYLREIDRVLAAGGAATITTPNRYSLSAEPHVSLWGVGWLPRPWQKPYVNLRGRNYDFVRLMSAAELARLLREHTGLAAEIAVPPVPDAHVARFPPAKAALAALYNRLARHRLLHPLFLRVGPFFRIHGRKPAALAAPDSGVRHD